MKKKNKSLPTNNSKSEAFTIEDCYTLFERNNYKQAFKKLSQIANVSDPHSCYLMFKLYFNGLGTEQNLVKAKMWLDLALQGKEPNAEYEYAIYYAPYLGPGEFNYPEQVKWLLIASEHGHKQATLELAKLYFSGKGCAENIAKAIELIQALSEQDPNYNFNEILGECYYTNLKLKEAFPHLKKAFNESRYAISGILATYYMRGIADVPQNVELAFQIVKKGAEHKDGLSEYILASHYKDELNFKLAKRYYQASYDHQILESAYELANILLKDPLRSAADEKKSVRLLLKASQLPATNRIDALADLGSCYFIGWGIEKNPKLAVKCFNDALKEKPEQAVALFGLANCYATGIGVKKDLKLYAEYLKKGAELNSIPALIAYANYFKSPDYEGKDGQEQFISWLNKASEHGSDEAAHQLATIYESEEKQDQELAFKSHLTAANLGHIESLKKVCKYYQDHSNDYENEKQCLFYNQLLINLFGLQHQVTDLFSERLVKEYINEDGEHTAQFAEELEIAINDLIRKRYKLDLPLYVPHFPLQSSELTLFNQDDLSSLEPIEFLE